MSSTRNCPSCGAPIAPDVTECRYCGEKIAAIQPQYQSPQTPQFTQPQPPQYQQPPQYMPPQAPQYGPVPPVYNPYVPMKSKTTAGVLGILLGGLGAHKFYLRKTWLGILYLVFCWTYIPSIIGLIEGIIYLSSSDEVFYNKYVRR